MSKNSAGVEVFRGFDIKYPEYSVITPHTGHSYTIRSLKVGEEETLKASLLTPNNLTDHLNKIIFASLVKKPKEIETMEDFLIKNTIRDRDALMYGLYHVTYKDIHNYDVTCSDCEHVNAIKIKFGESFSMVAWKGPESILEKEVEVKLEIAENITAIIKQPTLFEESKLLEDLAFSSDEERDKQMDLLAIKRFELDIGTSVDKKDHIKDRGNIKQIYNDLPATDRKLIDKAYSDNFGKYGVSLKTIVKCAKCQEETETEIDLVQQFFRSMYE